MDGRDEFFILRIAGDGLKVELVCIRTKAKALLSIIKPILAVILIFTPANTFDISSTSTHSEGNFLHLHTLPHIFT